MLANIRRLQEELAGLTEEIKSIEATSNLVEMVLGQLDRAENLASDDGQKTPRFFMNAMMRGLRPLLDLLKTGPV